MKWEYRFLQVQPGWDMFEQAPTVPFHLEEAGRQGWEAVSVVEAKVEDVRGYAGRPVFVILLKRAVETGTVRLH